MGEERKTEGIEGQEDMSITDGVKQSNIETINGKQLCIEKKV